MSSDPDEALEGIEETDPTVHDVTFAPRGGRRKRSSKSKTAPKKVTKKVIRQPGGGQPGRTGPPVGFFKEGGVTKPITAPKFKGKGKAQRTRVVKKKIVKPAVKSAPSKDPLDMADYLDWLETLGSPSSVSPVTNTRVMVPSEPWDKKVLAKYMKVPVADTGLIEAPLINWDLVEKRFHPPEPGSIDFFDYSHPDAPNGIQKELRHWFKMNRQWVTQGKDPCNLLLQGLPGTGKSLAVKEFAEESGLPYYYIPADPNTMTVTQLLGAKEMIETPSGSKTVWRDGTIIKAAKTGGILHIDEWSLMDPEIQTRLHELLDSNRRISLEQLSGGTVFAHPDLFVVITFNPSELGTQHARPLTGPIRSRFKGIVMGYPPRHQEIRILSNQVGFTPVELTPPKSRNDASTGTFADDIEAFMKVLNDVRQHPEDITYVPTMREAIDFGRELKAGTDSTQAIHRALVGKYAGDDRAKIENAIRYQFGNYK